LQELNVGLIGYKFMGKAHSHALRDVGFYFDVPIMPRMKVICGRDDEELAKAQAKFGWEERENDWRKVVERDDIHIIDVAASNAIHRDVVVAAAEAGKHVFCEKPLATKLSEAYEMLDAVEKAGVKHVINFNYRRLPAIQLAKYFMDNGYIGRVFHVRGLYLQDWIIDPEFPLVWRLTEPGAGSLGDLGTHVIDRARYLVGDFEEVVATQKTFIKERPVLAKTTGGLTAAAGEGRGTVNVDDGTAFIVHFENGGIGTVEASRFCYGHKNYEFIEVNGSEGSLRFNFERMNELEFASRKDPEFAQGFRTIQATEECHKYMEAYWPPGHIIGYEHAFINQWYEFLCAIASDKEASPSFYDGIVAQQITEAVEKSADERTWVKVKSEG